MTSLVLYVIADAHGAITGAGTCLAADALLQDPPTGIAVRVDDEVLWTEATRTPQSYRVAAGAVVPRLVMAPTISAMEIAADGVAECEITGLPAGAAVSITGAATGSGTIGAEPLVLTSMTPGALRIRARLDPLYLPWETVIHAV